MAKQELFEKPGTITKVSGANNYRVKLDNSNREIRAYKSGKMCKYSIKIIEGDKVKVAISHHDLTLGRITYRNK